MKEAKYSVTAALHLHFYRESTVAYRGGFISKNRDFNGTRAVRITFWDSDFKPYKKIIMTTDKQTFDDVWKTIERYAREF